MLQSFLLQVESHLLRGILDLIDRERQGEAVDRQLLAGLVRMLGDLGLYSSTFTPKLLEETATFYKAEGQRLIEATDVPHYLIHCEVGVRQCQDSAVLDMQQWCLEYTIHAVLPFGLAPCRVYIRYATLCGVRPSMSHV